MEIQQADAVKLLLLHSQGTLLIHTGGDHYKFWNIYYDSAAQKIITKWGRIGNKVQSNSAPGYYNAETYMQTKIKEKLKKGYRYVTDIA